MALNKYIKLGHMHQNSFFTTRKIEVGLDCVKVSITKTKKTQRLRNCTFDKPKFSSILLSNVDILNYSGLLVKLLSLSIKNAVF